MPEEKALYLLVDANACTGLSVSKEGGGAILLKSSPATLNAIAIDSFILATVK